MFLEAMLASPQWFIPLDLVKRLLPVRLIWHLFWGHSDACIMCAVLWYSCFVLTFLFGFCSLFILVFSTPRRVVSKYGSALFTCFSFRDGLCAPLPANLGGWWLLQTVEQNRSEALLSETQSCKTTTHFPWWFMKDSALFAGHIHSWIPNVTMWEVWPPWNHSAAEATWRYSS